MKRQNLSFILIVLFLITSFQLKAQEDRFFTIGLKGGIDIASMSAFKGYRYVNSSQVHINFIGGITADFELDSHWMIVSGLEYMTKGVNLIQGSTENSAVLPNYRAKYIQLPMHIGYKVKSSEYSHVIFHLGPYFAYGIGGKIHVNSKDRLETFGETGMKRVDYGIGAGITIDTKNFSFNFGYDHGLNSIPRSTFVFPYMPHINSKVLSVKNRVFQITFGYKFRYPL